MKNLKLFLTVVGLTVALGASAQSQESMRINEYLVINTNDFQDDFGQQSSWFELFNSSYGTVDLSGCFITDDPDNPKKYRIPSGDITTKIKPRQHVLFWADNQPFRGTFHVNFDLENAKEIIILKGDGKTIIDRIPVRHDLPANVSYGRTEDGEGSINGDEDGWAILESTSPSTNNLLVNKAGKAEAMQEMDPYGWIMAVTSMSVVFIALIILYLIFKNIGKANVKAANKKSSAAKAPSASSAGEPKSYGEVPAETYAAIATALHLFIEDNEAHDEESDVVTQRHTDRTYSPWSSKIYTLRQTPQVSKRK